MSTTSKPTKRDAAKLALKQALIYVKQPAAFVGQQGQIAATLDALTVSDLRDLMPEGVSKSKDGKPASKPLLIERFCQWVELGGTSEPKPAKVGKAKPAKKVKVEPEQAWQDLTDFLAAFSSEETTGQEMPDLRARFAELCDRLPAGKSGDDKGIPTLRNMVEAINLRMNEDESTLPVSGPKAKLMERIGIYFGLIDPPAVKKGVARVSLAEFSDEDLAAELESRRQASSPTHQLLTSGVC